MKFQFSSQYVIRRMPFPLPYLSYSPFFKEMAVLHQHYGLTMGVKDCAGL